MRQAHVLAALLLAGSLLRTTEASVFAAAADEAAALALAETVDLKTLSSADFALLIKERRWLPVAQRLLGRAQETPLDFSAPVRSAVSSVRKELDDLIRSLDKRYGEASQVHPAFQWAQNSSHVFLQVKFAQRWNAPGALEVENTTVVISDCCFSFKGFGEHSMIRKEYKLFLQFLDSVSEEKSSWHLAAAGRLTATIAKSRARAWERLLRSESVKPDNMGVWQDMQAKWKHELASMGDKKKKDAKSKRVEDDDDEDEEEEDVPECEHGVFHDSKVTEFCPKAWLTGKGKTWSVLFYSPSSTSKKAQSIGKMWRALADIAPMHNKKAAVGAVDCSRHQLLCDQHGVKGKNLPAIRRFASSSDKGVAFAGEPTLEDLAAWASKAEGEL